jgi:hypothetical protein
MSNLRIYQSVIQSEEKNDSGEGSTYWEQPRAFDVSDETCE